MKLTVNPTRVITPIGNRSRKSGTHTVPPDTADQTVNNYKSSSGVTK
jgi:hypothetical protein